MHINWLMKKIIILLCLSIIYVVSLTVIFKGGQSYVLALSYSEQLSAATHSMLQLSGLALDWRANLVETTVFQSFLFGIEGFYPYHYRTSNASALRLFEVYNSTLLNAHIHNNLSPLVSMDVFEVFLGKAARDITLVHFSTEHSTTPHVRRVSPDSSMDLFATKFTFRRNVYIADCSSLNLKGFIQLAKKVEHHLNNKVKSLQNESDRVSSPIVRTFNSHPFKVKKILCLNPKYMYTSDTLAKYVALPGTVIFTNWLGCCLNECTIQNLMPHYTGLNEVEEPGKLPLSTCEKSLRFSLPTKNLYSGRVRDAHFFHHSRITYAAHRQLEHLGISMHPEKGYVSVHIRIERILRAAMEKYKQLWARFKLDYLDRCVRKIQSHVREMRKGLQSVTSQNVESDSIEMLLGSYLLITDVGKLGTNSIRAKSSLHGDARLFLKILRSHGLQIHHSNLDLLGDRDARNSGYVSLVEMTMLTLGQRLLLVGGGGFQMNTAHKFYSLGRKKKDLLRESCGF